MMSTLELALLFVLVLGAVTVVLSSSARAVSDRARARQLDRAVQRGDDAVAELAKARQSHAEQVARMQVKHAQSLHRMTVVQRRRDREREAEAWRIIEASAAADEHLADAIEETARQMVAL